MGSSEQSGLGPIYAETRSQPPLLSMRSQGSRALQKERGTRFAFKMWRQSLCNTCFPIRHAKIKYLFLDPSSQGHDRQMPILQYLVDMRASAPSVQFVKLDVPEDHVLLLTLNRPQALNAVSFLSLTMLYLLFTCVKGICRVGRRYRSCTSLV